MSKLRDDLWGNIDESHAEGAREQAGPSMPDNFSMDRDRRVAILDHDLARSAGHMASADTHAVPADIEHLAERTAEVVGDEASGAPLALRRRSRGISRLGMSVGFEHGVRIVHTGSIGTHATRCPSQTLGFPVRVEAVTPVRIQSNSARRPIMESWSQPGFR